jgi:hypothetical protein
MVRARLVGLLALAQLVSAVAPASPVAAASPEPSPSVPEVTEVTKASESDGGWWVQGEYRISHPPTSKVTRSREPIVAANPLAPNQLAVAYAVGKDLGQAVVRISRDGGRTWQTTPRRPEGGGNHPVVAWGPGPVRGKARLYYSGMGGSNGRYHHLISWSDDEGLTWSRPYVADDTRPWFGGYPDMVVDTDRRSPNYGVVYHVYNWPKDPASGPGIRVLASGDYGETFQQVEVPRLDPPTGYDETWRISNRLATGPDGSLYLSGYQVDLADWRHKEPFAKGSTANVGRLAFTVTRLTYDRRRGRLTRHPTVLARSQPETSWNMGWAPEGLSGPMMEPHWSHGLAVDEGGRVYLATVDDGRIRLSRSDDRGLTWRTRALPHLPRLDGSWQRAMRPDVVAGDGFVAVVYHSVDAGADDRTSGGAAMVSFDRGRRWVGPRLISDVRWETAPVATLYNGVGLRDRATVLADGRTVYFAYGDARERPSVVYGARLRVNVPDPDGAAPVTPSEDLPPCGPETVAAPSPGATDGQGAILTAPPSPGTSGPPPCQPVSSAAPSPGTATSDSGSPVPSSSPGPA